MARTIWVKAAPQQADRVALWDRSAGPDGTEVFVAGQESPPVEVNAEHPAVLEALLPPAPGQPSRLVVLEGPALSAAHDLADAAEERRQAARAQSMATAEVGRADSEKAFTAAHRRAEQAEKSADDANRRVDELSAKLEQLVARAEADRAAQQAREEAERARAAARAPAEKPPGK